jgi:type IV pilus assembly protein PilX
MTMHTQAAPRPSTRQGVARAGVRPAQHGVVLVIAMVLLVVISLLGVTSLRNAGSTESVAGHVRTTELARQAADIALRHCESSVLALSGGAPNYITTLVEADILPPSAPPAWEDMSSETGWDSPSAATYRLPLALVNDTGMAFSVYQRPPECRVEQLPAVNTTNATFYVITARGFGPEVAPANARRQAPDGSEVWLQSHLEFQ